MVIAWVGSWSPCGNSTAIVHGKWPLNEPDMQRMVYSELLSS
jgi:hypothetical protein